MSPRIYNDSSNYLIRSGGLSNYSVHSGNYSSTSDWYKNDLESKSLNVENSDDSRFQFEILKSTKPIESRLGDTLELTKPNNKRKSPPSGSLIFGKAKIDVTEKKIKEKLEPIESRIANLEYKQSEMKKTMNQKDKY